MPVKKYVRKKRVVVTEFDGEFDEVDRAPCNYHVTNLDIFSLVYSVIIHIVDVGFDVNLAYHYFRNGLVKYFILTMVFMFAPALLITLLSLRMYVADGDKVSVSRNAVKRKFICVLVLILQLAPVMRYCDSLNYALRSRRAEREGDRKKQLQFYRMMLNEDSDVALLRVFECYLESAPQQVLQVSLLLFDSSQGSPFHWVQQGLSIASSFLSMAWCMASYHRSIRFDQENKNNISWAGTSVQFLWHLNVTISRILCVALVASFFPLWTGIAVGTHWFMMTIWVAAVDNTAFCGASPFFEIFFAGSVGLVYIFNYIGIQNGPSRWNYLFYYPLCFAENVAGVAVWAYLSDERTREKWYFLPLVTIPLLTFAVGMIFLVLYYTRCHPSQFVEKPKDCELPVVPEAENLRTEKSDNFGDCLEIEHLRE